ncbi:acid phosphatase PHO1 [Magnaporthiopsis poae ATCC 64411]|uniref:Acid phosphatase PHO1 n=1 Tax=Magnaporthiopsis poae (strain ATCC 64411 / 73-15) TaxID=644358 RepID=A0A0C4EGU7_MAGP6|nr:acid phosphatase PHO1 [Magnaporthiopsis poae ATCC 64411]
MCPTFVDDYGRQQAQWQPRWLPAFKARLSQYISGDLQLEDGQWNDFAYICGFESQIRGRLSPFCDTLTDADLAAYEYQQDLRYWYGHGPGAAVSSRMMVPFLDALVKRFSEGRGVGPDGTSAFAVPKLLMNFLNDGQLNQLAAAIGVFDEQQPLPTDRMPEDRLWRSSRISPMRGTIAFERLNCRNETYIRIRINEAVYPVPSCQDGPGRSCRVADYAKYVGDKLAAIGSFAQLCNATAPGTPSQVQGASFLTNLNQKHLKIIHP